MQPMYDILYPNYMDEEPNYPVIFAVVVMLFLMLGSVQ